jgi:Fe-S oxidoreductase
MASALKGQKNIWGGLQQNRDRWITDELRPAIKEQAKVGYFAGCTASFVEQDIAQASARLLQAAGVEFTTLGQDEMCCGIPMLVAGKWELFEAALRHNAEAMKARGVEEVVTSCPACWLVWNTYYPQWAEKLGIPFDFKATHYSQVLSEKIRAGELVLDQVPESLRAQIEATGAARVTFHDSCHIGRAGGVYEPPRDLIRAIPNVELVEMAHSKEDALCCGSVLTRIGEPHPTSEKLGARRIGEAEASGADALLALCPCCQFQLRVSAGEQGSELPVIDLARLSAEALGVTGLPDPNPEVLSQWAMFEQFIALMTPDGMVGVMDALTPQLLDAMPLHMGALMRGIGHAPASMRELLFRAMAPMMPLLFPKLLPGMMPKVLPHMIALVEQRIPMPDYLRNQLPDLFPEVVGNVMPAMLPEVSPKYVPLLFEHLRH